MEKLKSEFAVHLAGGGRGPSLTYCYKTLLGIPPTSVQPERDFSLVKALLGENRGRMSPQTLDDIFLLKRVFSFEAL